jgi:hypothetical protein
VASTHDGDVDPINRQAGRLLAFRLGGELHAVRVSDVGGVVSCEALRQVPGSPAGVLGLAEWRGSVLTVLDLARLLERSAPDEPACLIRLGPPMDQTALHLPATVQLIESRLERRSSTGSDEGEPIWFCEGEPIRLVDPWELVRRVDAQIRELS